MLEYDFLKTVRFYCRQTVGSIAIMFALMAPLLFGAAGMALDYSNAYLVQQRMAQALDAAALAAAASSTDPVVIEQKVQDFLRINFPEDRIGSTFDPVVTVNGDQISVSGSAEYSTWFMGVLGFPQIEVHAETTVQREVQGIEVVLVMDNTGSMSSYNNIATLRTAATNFVNIMFSSTDDPEFIKIGLVPYSTSVNVGSYGLGLNPDGSAYGDAFVNNPEDYDYDPVYNSSKYDEDWMGCVLAEDYPDDTIDHEGPWDMYRYCRDQDGDAVCDRSWSRSQRRYIANRSPNYICPESSIMPLSSDQEGLLDHIDTMQADGHTLGNFGMVWGYRVLSPDFPFEEARSYSNEEWRKAIVMMTDGVNTMHPYYSAYGPTSDHRIDAGDLNDRFAEVCEEAKDRGIIVYTITFTGGVSGSTKNFYRNCATSQDQYYDAPSQDDLVQAFETIGRELSNLHITN